MSRPHADVVTKNSQRNKERGKRRNKKQLLQQSYISLRHLLPIYNHNKTANNFFRGRRDGSRNLKHGNLPQMQQHWSKCLLTVEIPWPIRRLVHHLVKFNQKLNTLRGFSGEETWKMYFAPKRLKRRHGARISLKDRQNSAYHSVTKRQNCSHLTIFKAQISREHLTFVICLTLLLTY